MRRSSAGKKKRNPVGRVPLVDFGSALVAILTTTATTAAATAVFTTGASPTTATAAATATTRTFFTRAGDVDREGATVHFLAVQGFNGSLRLIGRTHRDEAETARTTAQAIHHQVGFHDRAVRREGVVQVILCSVEGKVSYKQFVAHASCAVQTAYCFH